jgi:hypothetical protein
LGISTTANKLREIFSTAGQNALASSDKEADLFGEEATMERELGRLNNHYRPGKTEQEKKFYRLNKSMTSVFRYSDLVKSLLTKK